MLIMLCVRLDTAGWRTLVSLFLTRHGRSGCGANVTGALLSDFGRDILDVSIGKTNFEDGGTSQDAIRACSRVFGCAIQRKPNWFETPMASGSPLSPESIQYCNL